MRIITVGRRRLTGFAQGRRYIYKRRVWVLYYYDHYYRFRTTTVHWYKAYYYKLLLKLGIRDVDADE